MLRATARGAARGPAAHAAASALAHPNSPSHQTGRSSRASIMISRKMCSGMSWFMTEEDAECPEDTWNLKRVRIVGKGGYPDNILHADEDNAFHADEGSDGNGD